MYFFPGGLDVQHQGGGRFSVWWGHTSWFVDSHLLTCLHTVEWVKKPSEVSSTIRVLTSFVRTLPSWSNHIPKALLPNTIALGIRRPHMNFGKHKYSDPSRYWRYLFPLGFWIMKAWCMVGRITQIISAELAMFLN